MSESSQPSVEYPPAFLAVSAYYGPPTILPEVIDTDLFMALSNEQKQRAKSALGEQISVIPRAKGMYWIISYTSEEPEKYSVNIDTTTCTCEDFMYNCDPETGVVCKHIWRVRYLLHQRAIPAADENPYNWILLQLEQDRQFLKDDYTKIHNEIQTLQDSIIQDKSWRIDYNWAYRRRAEILSKLPFVTVSIPQDTPLEILDS